MSERGPSKGRGTRVSGSVIAGLLLVPATAIAAVAIVGATARPPAAEAIEEVTTTTEAIDEPTTTSTTTDVSGLTDAEALEKACTESAQELLERELDDSIDELETAALDALRQICDENGMTIAGPPEPAPIVTVVTVEDTSTTSTTDASDTYVDGDDDDDDRYDDDDHDDD
ncbi:MAG: hypothetical protein M3112_06010, partial [Actinomycetia bacterium]|nr:hypothetical protein [Actinomycetes bacterium]